MSKYAGQRERIIVVKVGGSVQDDRGQMKAICKDVAAAARAGERVVVVHGGGKAITAAMKEAGLAARFVMGQRYTDEATLGIVERVLCGAGGVNAQICEDVEAGGGKARGFTSLSTCVLSARRQGTVDKEGKEVDLGRVGRVVRVDADVLAGVEAGVVPVIAPVALDVDEGGGKLNVNADLAAGMVARAVGAAVFVMVSDTPGIRVDEKTYARELSVAEIAGLKAKGVIDGGMLPKVEACEMAMGIGGCEVVIVDGRVGGVLGDVLGGRVAGTRIVK